MSDPSTHVLRMVAWLRKPVAPNQPVMPGDGTAHRGRTRVADFLDANLEDHDARVLAFLVMKDVDHPEFGEGVIELIDTFGGGRLARATGRELVQYALILQIDEFLDELHFRCTLGREEAPDDAA